MYLLAWCKLPVKPSQVMNLRNGGLRVFCLLENCACTHVVQKSVIWCRRLGAKHMALMKQVKLARARPTELDPERVPKRQGLPYRLQSLAEADLANVVVSGLQKKQSDVNFISEVCGAAQRESGGRMEWITGKLARRRTEKRFHQLFARSLPRVSKIDLPIVLSRKKKRVAMKSVSGWVTHIFFIHVGMRSHANPVVTANVALACNWNSGVVLPSAYMDWLQKRPWLLRAICFGTSTPEDRATLLG